MNALPDPSATPQTAPDLDALNRLRADYPDWAIQHLPAAGLPWEARRLPFRRPPSRGFTAINAATHEHLRDLIGGVLQVEAQAAAEGAAR